MPLYEFKCSRCGYKFEKLKVDYKELTLCPDCKGVCCLVPSVSAYRRDHTVIEGVRK